MELTVGAILDGKVKSITNFGAFIALPENKTGLVHISEVANTYVSDVREHLTEGQDVKVMVLSAEADKINLSIKRLEAKPQREERAPRKDAAPRPARTARFRWKTENAENLTWITARDAASARRPAPSMPLRLTISRRQSTIQNASAAAFALKNARKSALASKNKI